MSSDETAGIPVCGICGRLMNDAHNDHKVGGGIGKRVEYVVVNKRGGIAEFREAGVMDSKIRKTDAATLAYQLRVEESSLPGRRYSCWVEPAEYGVFRSDFKLIED